MRRKKLLAGLLIAALLVGSASPAGVMGTEVPEESEMEQLTMEETERQEDTEEAITAEEDLRSTEADANKLQDEPKGQVTGEEYTKSAEADANDFVIEDGVLTDYFGSERNVVIPNEVTAISSYAFQNCSNIISVTIPESVTDISTTAFNGCNDLIEINVVSGNPQYSSEGGLLYNKEKSKCLLCPKGMVGEAVISDNVVSIEDWAFEY